MKQQTMVVQGKQVNASIIAAFARRVESLDEVLSVWANAGALQLAQHGNINWLNKLFDMPVLRLKTGDLSKLGAEVMRYISAHYPAVKWDKDNGKVCRAKVNKDSIQTTHFVTLNPKHATCAAVANDEGVFVEVVEQRNKLWIPHGDFSLTLTEFRNLDRTSEKDEETEPTVQAKAFVKQADKAMTALAASRFIGAEDELQAAADKAKALFLLLEAKIAKNAANGKSDSVDMAKAAELLKSGQKGKSARAGGKVEGAAQEAA